MKELFSYFDRYINCKNVKIMQKLILNCNCNCD